ncbi:hypothetical protein F5Y18DRAFT_432607 [Xylariaceae sp. FL1019]|nr:hypothetical protein F5Y18DRAFT_432607 [Xylariaceae sp. FL1019]
MDSHMQGTAALSRGFRYVDGSGPKTPEPSTQDAGEQCHAPPRPPRLRLKRRQVSQLNAPTQQFLASIAAADVPVPSVEDDWSNPQEKMPSLTDCDTDVPCGEPMARQVTPRLFSPPKTPSLEIATAQSTTLPDWYLDSPWSDSDLESTPDYESSRPSTAFSTQTSSSLMSMFSRITDGESRVGPQGETKDVLHLDTDIQDTTFKSRTRKAPWTRAMSAHLWATYILYLSDPRVTPIRQGKSCIPPHGVCARVSRQAQRSWKGARMTAGAEVRSQMGTNNAEPSKPFIQWPHTPAATRAHLRELCKLKAMIKPGHCNSESPAPFTKAANRRWNRRYTPARSASVFSAQEMAMSLTLSTSDTMQPHGPLAQLTGSKPTSEVLHVVEPTTTPFRDVDEGGGVHPETVGSTWSKGDTEVAATQLGSPFLAKSYGPSSSTTLTAKLSLPKQSNTMGARKLLKSPVRLTNSRSGTQKRRSVKGHEEKPWKRPSLTAAFFQEGPRNTEQLIPSPSCPEPVGQFAITGFQKPSAPVQTTPVQQSASRVGSPSARRTALSPGRSSRLGSPFSGANLSHSFPNRLSSARDFSLAALRRPFATVQQSSHVNTESTTPPPRSSLASRLAYLDQRLKDFRNRGNDRRRSQSPL